MQEREEMTVEAGPHIEWKEQDQEYVLSVHPLIRNEAVLLFQSLNSVFNLCTVESKSANGALIKYVHH